ncbi:amidohydrolase [Henriciella marina]|uniref:amidohydrolase n=1 Tax=Henriciella marina TaxID=453851 RepID=UPI00037DD20F|nr:amidohydrolase [Henriciella marina]
MKFAMRLAATLSVAALLSACGNSDTDTDEEKAAAGEEQEAAFNRNPYPSTYAPYPSRPVLLQNATVYDGVGNIHQNYDVLLQDGDIASIGEDIEAGDDVEIIDATGKFVTPGIIDNHSHLGVYASPGVTAHSDGNEISGPVTAEVWAEHGIWPQDPGFTRALAGGVTSMQILPGSANLFGGRGVTIKNVLSRTVQGMKFPDAPYTLKMACGENPKRVYGYGGGRFPGGAPYSRMGNVAGYRGSWIEAQAYQKKWQAWEEDGGEMPTRNLELDTLSGVLDGDILVHMHCYRADEMAQVIDMSKEFGYKVTSFHHAVESYKIADRLAEENICSSMWADWWGFKMEAYDGIRENIPLVHQAGACAIVHSDSDIGIQRLNQEAAKALADGRRAGIEISDADAWTWLSANPARSLGIFDETGSLEVGKDADVVVWNGDPFSTFTNAEKVYVDGALMFDLDRPDFTPVTDFELGQPGEGDVK